MKDSSSRVELTDKTKRPLKLRKKSRNYQERVIKKMG